MTDSETQRTIDAIWRIESPKLVAGLARMVHDVGIAEDLAHDALVAALEQWPVSGVPRNPGAWLMATSKRRAIDLWRRNKLLDRKHEAIGYELQAEQQNVPDIEAAIDDRADDLGDDLLRLIFIACHPVLATDAQVALTLRLLGGLTTGEIARAFLVPEATVAQRIVRAKRTLADKEVPYEIPRGEDRDARLSSVLGVLYLIFNEGYTATTGDDWMRPALCDEALRLGRIVAELAPQEPEVHGLVALMEIQASRQRARVGPKGEPIVLRRAESRALGSTADPARADSAGACRVARGGARIVCPAGSNRGLSRAGAHRGRNGLASHRRAIPATGEIGAVAHHRAQSGRCRGDGLRPGSRPGDSRYARRRTGAQGLPSPAKRAW